MRRYASALWVAIALTACALGLDAAPVPRAPEQPTYANRPEVREFIRGMVEHHGFTEHELHALFAEWRTLD